MSQSIINPYAFPPAPGVTVTDSFDRADSSTTLGTASDGVHAWTAHLGTWGINTNRGRLVTGHGGGLNVATVDPGVSDCTITLALQTVSATPSNNCGIAFRYVDANNYWVWITDLPNSDLYLQRNVAGSFTTVYSNTNQVVQSGDFLKVELLGSSIKVYYADVLPNWTLEHEATDSTHQSATRHGLFVAGSTGTSDRVDNFSLIS